MKIIDFYNIAVDQLKLLVQEDSNCHYRKPVDFAGYPTEQQMTEETGLNVRSCYLTSLTGLAEFVAAVLYNPLNLVYADFSCNKIVTVAGIEYFSSIRVLYLQGNDITSPQEVYTISYLPILHSLKLHGNPVILYSNFRYFCVANMPQLQSLDGVTVTQSERKQIALLGANAMIKLKKRENVVLRK